MKRTRLVVTTLSVLALVVGALVLFACTQTPTSVPLRTFERAQRVDFVCLQLAEDNGDGTRRVIRPRGRPLSECTPTPPDEDGAAFTNQLVALVTQTTRGEVAVVNLTSGVITDVSAKTPNANFLPVGTMPTDIVAAPDGQLTFVASAEPNKPAIYALPSTRILGDKAAVRSFDEQGRSSDILLPPDPLGTPTLASWPVCALPQAPSALSYVSRPDGAGYELVAVLPGDRLNSAKVVTIDPAPFMAGAGLTDGDGGAGDVGAGGVVGPGSLAPCPITAATELADDDLLPPTFREGARGGNGVPWVDAGELDLACELPAASASCGPKPCCASDAGADGGAEACAPPDRDAGDIPLDVGPLDPPRVVALARDGTTLYVADDAVPFVHVLDLGARGAITERAPLVATSLTDPTRAVGLRALAVSPPTRDYKKFLYAVDARAGSLVIFDVSEGPSDDVRFPITRPYPELNPFQPPDRVAFSAPVVAVEFARADVPVRSGSGEAGIAGALCNPNPSATDPGVLYRANSPEPSSAYGEFGPRRLRGIFGFVTLANGSVAVIDVDDWDAPCRRPAQMITPTVPPGQANPIRPFSSIAPNQPDIPGDPYGAPEPSPDWTSDEAFFPVSLPHRLRSAVLLRASTSTGKQVPYVSGAPAVDLKGLSLATSGTGSETTPLLRPTPELGAETYGTPGVRFSFEVPDVHVDQDWTLTYEGALPGFDGFNAIIGTEDNFSSLVLRQPGAGFCAKGVEDWDLGRERAAAISRELQASGRPQPAESLERRIADYVQITSDLLGPDDPYWSIAETSEGGQCWQGLDTPPGRARHDLCQRAFGAPGDESVGRDFPILEAYDDRLVLGRFFTFPNPDGLQSTREVVYKDPSNESTLKLAQCCFHGQAKFRVRGGGQWVLVGSTFGFLSHLAPDAGGRCAPSCDPREALLNGRAPGVPRADVPAPSRDSVLALRNPMFSFFVENGVEAGRDVAPVRDTVWRFSTRGQFQSLSFNIAGQSTIVNPQSMRFVAPLGQIAVVDAANQGLVLVDLRSVSIARAPFF